MKGVRKEGVRQAKSPHRMQPVKDKVQYKQHERRGDQRLFNPPTDCRIEGALGEVRIGYKINARLNWRFAFNAGAPVLTGFVKAAKFSF